MNCTRLKSFLSTRRLVAGAVVVVAAASFASDATADRRAAARSNLGGARSGVANAAGVARASQGGVSRPTPNRPAAGRPNTSIPSLGGGLPINHPAPNRPSLNQSFPNRDNGARSGAGGNRGISRPSQGMTRPGITENLPSGRPNLNQLRPEIPGGDAVNRPDIGSRPIARPVDGNGVIGQLPDRPSLSDRPSSRPSRDRLEDFLGMQRPDRDQLGTGRPDISRPDFERPNFERPGINRPDIGRPGVDRPGINRPDRDWSAIDRPSWNDRPNRPIIGGGDRNIQIHNRPTWINMDRDRLDQVHGRWNGVIVSRPGDLHRWTQRHPHRVARWRSWGNSVRFRWHMHRHGVFGPIWWTTHPPVFCQWHHWHHWNRHPWNFWWERPSFTVLSSWFVGRAPVAVWAEPIFYDFGPGGNVVLTDNRVFISGVDVGSADEFAQSAGELATVAPPQDEAEQDAADWEPLGTFAVSISEEEGEPTRFVQLAINTDGIVSGTFFNTQTEVSQAVLGQVDFDTQRVAVRLGEDDDLVIETGLYNLTLDEVPVMLHYGTYATEFSLLIRMEEPDGFDGDDAVHNGP